jgi:cyanophycin synthetase
MEILKIFALRGPNVWSRRTVLEAWVDLGELKDRPSNSIPGLYDRLTTWLPNLIEHRCGIGTRGGFLERLRDGTYCAHILEHLTIELENLAGTPVGFGKARETTTPGLYKVAVRYRDEQVGRACLTTARELLLAAIHEKPFDVQAEVKKLRDLAEEVCLGTSTAAIVAAAEARNIPVRRLNGTSSLVQLGQGARQRRIWTAETDRTSAIGESIASDKELTKRLLRASGVPVPEGRLVESAADAWEAAREIGGPVVVKPRDGNHGRAVFTNLTAQAEIETAYNFAVAEGSGVIVERFAPGNEHRLLVVGDRLVAAARGEPAYVTGDGKRTVRQLVDEQLNTDPRRGVDDTFPLNLVDLDAASRLDLERQGFKPESVPPAGTEVLVQRNGNVAFDVTEKVHPAVAAQAVLAARIVGLDIAGLDVVAEDISHPLEMQGGAIVEVNAGPGLHMHVKPAAGTPQPVGEAIVGHLFPGNESGRIPVICVTGTEGRTEVSRLIAHLLRRQEGGQIGLACSDGLWAGERAIKKGDCADLESAQALLINPVVEAAVLEAKAVQIVREGLGFDRCQVAVVTNLGEADRIRQHFVETPEDIFTVLRCPVDVVLPSGTAVLRADDPWVAKMASLSAGAVIFFGQDGNHPVIVEHRAQGKRAAFMRGEQIILAEGEKETVLGSLSKLLKARPGRDSIPPEYMLAAVCAAWAVGVSFDSIRSGMSTFLSVS